jgi:hypothetical protein
MTSFPTRRRLLANAAAGTTAALIGTALTARPAAAYTAPTVLLPTIGQTVNMSCNAFGTVLVANTPPPLPTLNCIGSLIFKVLIGGRDYVRLQLLDYVIEAAHPTFGKITLKLPDIDIEPASTLALGPGGLAVKLVTPLTATFERCGDAQGPFEFQTVRPAVWTNGDLLQFPPPAQGTNPDGSPTGGALFTAPQPVSFAPGLGLVEDLPAPQLSTQLPGALLGTTFQFQNFNINMGQLLA